MTYEEILEVPVEEKIEKEKPEVSEDEVLSTMPSEANVETEQKTVEENKEEVVNQEEVENTTETSQEKEDGKNIELANNVIEENKQVENSNLPVDIKPYLKMVKEKLLVVGKLAAGVLEKIGDFVENLFKKKN